MNKRVGKFIILFLLIATVFSTYRSYIYKYEITDVQFLYDNFLLYNDYDNTVWELGKNGQHFLRRMKNISNISFGSYSGMALNNNGKLNLYGTTEYFTYYFDKYTYKTMKLNTSLLYICHNENYSLGIENDNSLWIYGKFRETDFEKPTKLFDNVKHVSSNESYILIKTLSDEVYILNEFVDNNYNFIYLIDNIKDIYATKHHAFAISNEDVLYKINPLNKEIKNIKDNISTVYVFNYRLDSFLGYAIDNDSKLYEMHLDEFRLIMDNVVDVYSGEFSSIVIDKDNNIWYINNRIDKYDLDDNGKQNAFKKIYTLKK